MARFQTQLSLFAERKGGGEKGDIRYLQDYLDSGDFSNDRGKEGIEIFFFSRWYWMESVDGIFFL